MRATSRGTWYVSHMIKRVSKAGAVPDEPPSPVQSLEQVSRRRLDILRAATRLEDLMANPGNRFHALQGRREGTYAIAINDRWRVCFKWDDGATDIEITDYT